MKGVLRLFKPDNQNHNLLQTPTGVGDTLPERLEKYRSLESQVMNTFKLWSYDEVAVPFIEYPDMFSVHKGKTIERQMFQFNDETGRPVVLRPDFTPSVARLVAKYYNQHPLPLRLCYSGKVFRSGHDSMTAEKELYQVGVELVGGEAPYGDAELVAMAAETLENIGIDDFVICIGNLQFVNKLLESLEVNGELGHQIMEALNENNLVKYYQIVKGMETSEEKRELLKDLTKFRGGKENVQMVREMTNLPQVEDILAELETIFDILEGYDLQDRVTFDLSLVRRRDYYTGFIMEGYSSKLGFPLCGGGRYDNLMINYGMDLPATGFAFSFDSLAKLVPEKMLPTRTPKVCISYEWEVKDSALAKAAELRKNGKRVFVQLAENDRKTGKEQGKQQGVDEFYYISGQDEFYEQL